MPGFLIPLSGGQGKYRIAELLAGFHPGTSMDGNAQRFPVPLGMGQGKGSLERANSILLRQSNYEPR